MLWSIDITFGNKIDLFICGGMLRCTYKQSCVSSIEVTARIIEAEELTMADAISMHDEFCRQCRAALCDDSLDWVFRKFLRRISLA
jgi:hypothetical protein